MFKKFSLVSMESGIETFNLVDDFMEYTITTDQLTFSFKDEDGNMHEYKTCYISYGDIEDKTFYFEGISMPEVERFIKARKFASFNVLCEALLTWAKCQQYQRSANIYY